MKEQNMKNLVNYLSEYIKNNNTMYLPNDFSGYIHIFLDENQNDKRLHIDSFSEELARRLIADEQIKELDTNINNDNVQIKKYEKFTRMWGSWNILYDELKRRGKID
ncbi:TPA: hypothetical protein ACTXXA_003587 [Legionella anisa]